MNIDIQKITSQTLESISDEELKQLHDDLHQYTEKEIIKSQENISDLNKIQKMEEDNQLLADMFEVMGRLAKRLGVVDKD